MNKTTIFSIIGVVVIVGIIFVTNSNKDIEQDAIQESGFNMFVEDGGTYQCAVTQNIDVEGFENSVDGTVFIHEGMIRGNYAVETQGIDIETSLIVRDGFVYSWNSFTPMGVKAPTGDAADGDVNADMSGTFSWDAEQIGEYDCVEWEVDMAQFEIPVEITFQEV